MGELHSLAYTSSNSSSSSLHNSSQDLDFHHNLEVLNNTDTMSLVMDGNAPFLSSTLDSDFSTGYLEDALVEFSERSKRRRLMLYSEDNCEHIFNHSTSTSTTTTAFLDLKDYWNSSNWELYENFNCMMTNMTNFDTLSGEQMMKEEKTPAEEEAKSVSEGLDSTSSSSYKDSANTNTTKSFSHKQTLFSTDPTGWEEEGEEEIENEMKKKKKKRVINVKRVVYPFAMVKPGGKEGEVTLDDINQRILMPPARPVRHPVGDFACRPCLSPHGPGLSGKAVVAFTKIHTQGRGTITIIRTKG